MENDSLRDVSASSCDGHIHVVRDGDTLYKIAKEYDVKLFDVMRLNPYVNVYNLREGDEICIPSAKEGTIRSYVAGENDTLADALLALDTDICVLLQHNPAILELPLPEGLTLNLPVGMVTDAQADF